MAVSVPTKTEDSLGIEKSDSLPEGFTPNPKHFTTAAQFEALKSAVIEQAEAINAGGGGGPPDLTPITVADFATPAITIMDTAAGAELLSIYSTGLSGPTPIVIQPSVPADPNATGHGLTIAAGVGGANDQNGGTVEIDAGPGNGAGVAGNVKIGRNESTEVLIGKEGGGGDITIEGQITTVGHVPAAAADVATKGYVDSSISAAAGQKSIKTSAFVAVDGVYFVDTSAGEVAVTLPALASGRDLVFVKVGGVAGIRLVPSGAERVNGSPAPYVVNGQGAWTARTGSTGVSDGWWVQRIEAVQRSVVTGVQFGSTGYAVGTAGEYNVAYRRLRVIWAPLALSGTGFRIVAGTESGTGGGIGLTTEPLSGASNGSLRGFDGAYFTPITHPTHFISSAELGRVVVDDLVLDDPNNLNLWYRDGRLVGIAQADAQSDWAHTLAMAINCRPNDPTNAAYRFGSMVVFEVQTSDVMPDAETVLDDATRPPGWVVDGSVDLWVGEDFVSGTWTARRSGRVLTVTNGTAGVQKPYRVEATKHGCWSLHSDSFGVRRPGPLEGNAWRKHYLDIMSAAGFLTSSGGEFNSGGATTLDFDFRHNCTPGQALGLANGAIPARLPTLAASLSSFCPKDGTLTLDYGRNDAYARCAPPSGGLGQTVAVAVAAFFADLESAVSIGHSHMNAGRPIILADILRTNSTYGTLNEREFGRVVSELLPAKVAKWRRAYRPQIGLAKVRAKVTPTQAAANDSAVLWDGLHMADAVMLAYAQAHAEAFFEVMGYPLP